MFNVKYIKENNWYIYKLKKTASVMFWERNIYISELFDDIYYIKASVIIKILSILLDKCSKNYVRHTSSIISQKILIIS